MEQNKQPVTGELANQCELTRSSDASSDSELNKQCEQNTFAAHFETDEILQKVITLIQKPDSTKINRLPALEGKIQVFEPRKTELLKYG